MFFFKQKTAYEVRISDWSSDVCSSDLLPEDRRLAMTAIPGCRQRGSQAACLRADHACRRMLATSVSSSLVLSKIGRASCREKSVSVRVDLGGRRIIKQTKRDVS